jgi:hypothetical protein
MKIRLAIQAAMIGRLMLKVVPSTPVESSTKVAPIWRAQFDAPQERGPLAAEVGIVVG